MSMIDNEALLVWYSMSKLALEDGILFDIKINNTHINDWDRFILTVKRECTYKFYTSGNERDLPSNLSHNLFGTDDLNFIKINIGLVTIECFLLTDEEIDLTLIPSTTLIDEQFKSLINFTTHVATELKKDVIFSLENAETPFMRISPFGKISM